MAKRSFFSEFTQELDPLTRLWILRILMRLKVNTRFIRRNDFADDDIATSLGLGKWVDSDTREFNPVAIRAELSAIHEKAEATCSKARPSAAMGKNIKRLAKMLELTPVDCRILEFVVLIHNDEALDNAADWIGQLTTTKVIRALARILDLPPRRVADSLSPEGVDFHPELSH